MTINFNTEPYWDDYNESKKFYRILYRPGYAVQARELTQMQAILQNQVNRFGSHIFKEGAMVIPGQASIDTKVGYIKLEASYGGVLADSNIPQMVGMTVENGNGLQAEVIYYAVSSGSDAPTLFVRYKNSGDNNITKVFSDTDIITDVGGTYSVQAIGSNATGMGSIASITQGVYFIKNHFVLVEPQTIILDKYSDLPSYRIGLVSEELIITAEEDNTLFDNAQNSFNYAAPGAHRYSIIPTLTSIPDTTNAFSWKASSAYQVGDVLKNGTLYYKVTVAGITSASTAPTHTSGSASNGTATLEYFTTYSAADDTDSDQDFIELIRVYKGQVKKETRRTEYSVLEETLARRTFDESGNYTVRNFEIDVREYRNNNRGAWDDGTVYLIGDVVTNAGNTYVARNSATALSNTPPTHTAGTAYDGPGLTGVQWEYNPSPYYNRGIHTPDPLETLSTQQTNEGKLAIGLEAGKAYVQGYEIEKVSTEYVAVDKCRGTAHQVSINNGIIPSTVGNYVLITGIYGKPPVDYFQEVTIYDRLVTTGGTAPSGATAIGTARVRYIEWDNGTIGSATAIYKLGLFDIKMNGAYDFARKAKSFYVSGFTANIQPILTQRTGNVTVSGTAVTGYGTTFQTSYVAGDFMSVNGGMYRIASVDSQTGITLTAGPGSPITTQYAHYLVTTSVREPENTSLIFPIPYYAINSVSDVNYTVYEVFASQTVTTNSITVTTASGTMASAAETDNYIAFNTTTNSIAAPTSITTSGNSATLTFSGINGNSIIVIGAVNKTLAAKAKLLQTDATVTFTTAATAQKTELLLGKADGYRLVSVKMKTGSFASPGATYSIDVTDRFDFDNGQRDTHYDIARLVLKNSYAPPEAPIQVTFEYFTHQTGDYFTKSSYPSNVDYKAIPYYKGQPLRDCFDFRPRINDEQSSFNPSIGNNASISLVPKRGIDIICDFTYHLARKAKIAIDLAGNFYNIDGVPSLNPGEPLDPALGMVLYNLTLEPYTFGTTNTSVQVGKIDNKRYTMRDIGKLEKRIDNLEYYTSLSLLEQQTESLDVIDSVGDSRFKNGFIVDNFAGHNTGDATSSDYFCSIDQERGELRPFFAMQNINLLEKNSADSARTSSQYKLYGDVITLPVVEHLPIINQSYASRLENINPFAVFTFLGDVKINPSSDDWFEVSRRPDLVVDVEGNYSTIKNIAEKAGVLGTVWNSWQNQWSGTPVVTSRIKYTAGDNWAAGQGDVRISIDEMRRRFGIGQNATIDNARQVTVETTATQVGQSRTGIKTSLVTKIDRQIVGDRVLSTAAIPYMRSRNVLVQINKLKPGTRFYPFFDGVDISAYCTPSSKIEYVPAGADDANRYANHELFNVDTNVGGLSEETARRIGTDTQMCLNKGDIIIGASSGATAVVVGKEYDETNKKYYLYVVNVKGTFTSETITGSVSGKTGTFIALTTKAVGSTMITNSNGELQFLFNIPNNDAIRFRCGTRELKLVDVATVDGQFTSRARANYHAEGVLETRQQTVHAVRNAELVEERLVDNRVITQTAERIVADTGWWDPLAQTFLIEQKGGCFLSKVDIFFATKDPKIPVMLEIREVVNGYPGKRVLPFSRVTLKPENVNAPLAGATIDTSVFNTVTLDDTTVAKYDKATTFTFPSPVYVQENTEYAIVLASDSNNYKVWVSQMGDTVPGTSRTISEQPYLGSLFKSQNASTWTADQTQDLKFTMYRAKFDVTANANVQYVNDVVPYQTLDTDPFEIKSGTTTVRVWQQDHGMRVHPTDPSKNSRVTITDSTAEKLTGYTGTGTITASVSSATIAGSGTAFSTQLAVGTLMYNSAGTYIGKVLSIASNTSLTLTANSAVAVSAGGSFKYRNPIQGIPANELYTTHTVSNVDLDSYTVTVSTTPTSSGYAGGSTVKATRNYQYDVAQPMVAIQTFTETPVSFSLETVTGKSVDGSETPYTAVSATPVLVNETNYFPTPRLISSELMEDLDVVYGGLGGAKSVTMRVTMNTSNDALSPILDTHRTSLVVINNKINSPSETNMNVANLDYNVLLSNATGVTISGNTITTSTQQAAFKLATVGKYLTVAGASTGSSTNLITAVAADGTSITFATAPAAITGNATLTQRERFVAENAPLESSTISKYVTKRVNLTGTIPSNYLRVKFAVNLPKEATVEVWYKTSVVGSTADFELKPYTQMSADTIIPNYDNGTDVFTDAAFSLDNMEAFDAVKVKLVLKSTNSAQVPRIKDLRVIACAA